jgi:nucleotide-binding universal stress UspA family protein
MMKLMVGFDGSNTAKDAVKLAMERAKAFGAGVSVVTAYAQRHDVKIQDMNHMEEADGQLTEIKKSFDGAGIPCEVHLLVNDLSPGESLVQFARENGIDEIVIGIRRRSKVGKLLFGSTAQFIILEASCPVLTVK